MGAVPTSFSSSSLQRPRVPPTYALPSQTALRYYPSTATPVGNSASRNPRLRPRRLFLSLKALEFPTAVSPCLRHSLSASTPTPRPARELHSCMCDLQRRAGTRFSRKKSLVQVCTFFAPLPVYAVLLRTCCRVLHTPLSPVEFSRGRQSSRFRAAFFIFRPP